MDPRTFCKSKAKRIHGPVHVSSLSDPRGQTFDQHELGDAGQSVCRSVWELYGDGLPYETFLHFVDVEQGKGKEMTELLLYWPSDEPEVLYHRLLDRDGTVSIATSRGDFRDYLRDAFPAHPALQKQLARIHEANSDASSSPSSSSSSSFSSSSSSRGVKRAREEKEESEERSPPGPSYRNSESEEDSEGSRLRAKLRKQKKKKKRRAIVVDEEDEAEEEEKVVPAAPPHKKETKEEKGEEEEEEEETKESSNHQDVRRPPGARDEFARRERTRDEFARFPAPDMAAAQAALRELNTVGGVAIATPLTGAAGKALRAAARREMDAMLRSMPEYAVQPPTSPFGGNYVLGGFQALGNPASFHNGFVRRKRLEAFLGLLPLFQVAAKEFGKDYKLEHLVDRLSKRPAGVKPTAESWHRDNTPAAKDSDHVFGGWWNFDDHPQQFSFVPGSQVMDAKRKGELNRNAGFNTIKKEAEVRECERTKKTLVVPPGGIVVFYGNIIHEVVATKAAHDKYRLYLSWRFTKDSKPLYAHDKIIANQGVWTIKSDQVPPMYAKQHMMTFLPQVEVWSKNFKKQCRNFYTVKGGKNKGAKYCIVDRFMKSLAEYGLPLYPAYKDHEVSIVTPNTEWLLPSFADDGSTHRFALHEA